ncbi:MULTISPECIES: mycofactocin oligosaccharide methyltransferase MftM [Streptomyces]|uniref:Class I SAM-dependent methyltransferase n=2 Tax=Streptomyces TaxID=1883 RepID=A0A3R7EKG6_9ACTN|nr:MULTISPECIES: mycofactocin oligosaccharide methyltransferase MftM [Streptomyces]KNE82544.1 SAM-dependent methyltransferase [Streptomyces fradiae]OFA52014.1 SAM-dependent methyltransferase [Streptomyces fradiae]PQM23102.1 class I SAM-dependent methyltransferase [Streptomyces xinghaiensis]RKM91467.1 class I SAM-dependent methyltransferase [Streptomyces xinghaiensis]RNC74896.1 class I SAM-dependent methyltransferase [Streptomyces xinghaiensis]
MSVPSPRIGIAARRIDPLAPDSPGLYADHLVRVVRDSTRGDDAASQPIVRTGHFTLRRRDRRIELGHTLRPGQLDNDLAGLLAEELFAPGWLSGSDTFERVFTGVVRSCVDGPLPAWTTFYNNTLARIRDSWRSPEPAEHSSIAGFAPVYRKTLDTVAAGTVLDVGSCFGFLPLLLAELPEYTVTASDLVPGTMRLLDAVAGAMSLRLSTLTCDAARVPLPDASVDTVTVIHVLEHLDPGHGEAVVQEALRLARKRVVVAVPYEEEPTAAYGHVRCFDQDQLTELGRRTGHRFSVASHHGGWLVLDPG